MSERKDAEIMTRREALRRALLGAAGLTVLNRGGGWAVPAAQPTSGAALPVRAKSVIQIWMWGGPSHLDTFDPKPAAGYDYCGPLNKPISTNVSGIQIGELLPKLAQMADKYSIIRSMTHGINGHETASYAVQTGHQSEDRTVYPCIGAVVSLFKGFDHGYKGHIPPYVLLTESQGRFSEAGFLGSRYKPFATGGDPNQKRFAVEGIVTEGISEQRQQSRRQLLHSLDTLGKAMPANPQFGLFDQSEQKADQIVAETGKVFDLAQEKDDLRDRYGRNTFGQSCLMARRLVENGVPLHYDQLQGVGQPQAALRDDATQTARDGSGNVRIASGSFRPPAAGQHRRVVERRVRTHSQGSVGSSVEWWQGPLRQMFQCRAGGRRLQGRARDRRIGRKGRGSCRAARSPGRFTWQHLHAARHRPGRPHSEFARPGRQGHALIRW
jgi:hypothetical protein